MKIKLTQIPSDGHCWHEDGSICPYYDPKGEQHGCRLWDFNTVCHRTKEVVV